MSDSEKMEITAADVGVLDLDEPKPAEPTGPKDGDCFDCGGPCKGHKRDFCDARFPDVKCTHAPGSRQCDHTTLHDDDEVSEQALEAARLGTRKFSVDD